MQKYIVPVLCLIIVFVTCSLTRCENEPVTITDNTKVAELYTQLNHANKAKELFKKEAQILNKQVDSLKARKAKIVYRAKFDTLATIDTVIVELIKCDSVVKVSDSIIIKQDEKSQALVEALNESEKAQEIQVELLDTKDKDLKYTKKLLRKEKRKLLFTRIGIVVATVALIVILL